MPRTATLDVSREGLVAHMGDQFVRADTFIRELIQNARRAGASQVEINYEPDSRTLEVADDGVGIASEKDLLILGESGFRKDFGRLAEERPFGMGFAAAIFAADFIKVATRDFFFECSQDTLTTFGEVEVHDDLPGLFHDGTKISLVLSESRAKALGLVNTCATEALGRRLASIVCGFPIPVFFNGEELPRPLAIDSSFEEHGDLLLRVQREACAAPSSRHILFYQGLPLPGSSNETNPDAVGIAVHLPNRIRVRTPDRDSVVDEAQQGVYEEIDTALRVSWKSYLVSQKRSLSPDDFVIRWGNAAKKYAPEVLCDMPIPASWVSRLAEPVRQERWMGDGCDYRSSADAPIPVGTALAILSTDWFYGDDCEAGSARGLYAYLNGIPLLNERLPAGHWARDHLIDYDSLEPSIKVCGELSSSNFDGHGVCGVDVVFCEHFLLNPGTGEEAMKVSSWPVWEPDSGRLILPRGAGSSEIGNSLLQASSYMDEFDQYNESDFEADVEELAMMAEAAFVRGGDPAKILEGVLRGKLGQVCGVMPGRSFSVQIDEAGRPTVEAA